MIRRTAKFISLLVVVVLLASVIAGCGSYDSKTTDTPSAPTQAAQEQQNQLEVSYPVKTKEPVTLTYWCEMEGKLSTFVDSMNQTEHAKELEKRTGVKIKYIHPPTGGDAVQQAFTLMIASRELPDIIEYNVNSSYPGGPEKALSDQVIAPLKELAAKYSPDMMKFLKENELIRKYCSTSTGEVWCYPSTVHESNMYPQGPMMRGDWLEELNLSLPETIDDWYHTLKAFKESGKCEYPFSWSEKAPKMKWSGEIAGAYGVLLGLWQMDEQGKVQYGYAMPEYKEFLAEMNKWYKEGLIDPEFASQDRSTLMAKIIDGKIGAWLESGRGIYEPQNAWRSQDPDTKKYVVGVPHVTLKKGELAPFGFQSMPIKLNNTAVITTACKNKEVAAIWLNYGYTEEGSKLYAWGIEGKSYNIVDGKAVGVDFILQEPPSDKLTLETYTLNWLRWNGPFIARESLIPDELSANPTYIKAQKETWKNVSNALKMPEFPPPADKADEFAALYTEIDTYCDEMFIKFIMGEEPLENFDKYVENLNRLGLQRCIEIKQETLDEWLKR